MGGLSRRAYLLNKIRKEETRPVLVLDGGAMLFSQPYIPDSQLPAKKIQASGLIEAMARMEYDAFGIAPQDLSGGAEFLVAPPDGVQLPWLSMNLVQKDNGGKLFAPFLLKKVGKLTVGVLSLTGLQNSTPGMKARMDYRTIAWEKALADSLNQVREKADLIVLLSSMSPLLNQQIAEKYNDIHLIIQAGQTTANRPPQLFGNALITQIGSRGKYMGRIDIDWQPSHTWEQSSSAQIKALKDLLDRTNWQIGRFQKRSAQEKLKQNAQYGKLLEEKRKLTHRLTELETRVRKDRGRFSTFKNSFLPLSISLPEDPEIREIVLRTKLAVNTVNRKILAKTAPQPSQNVSEAFVAMAGWKACRSCHAPQTDFWQETAHAKAFQTLIKVSQEFNPECLICHVTLPSYDREIVTAQDMLTGLQDEYKAVGCETCHGPARNHTQHPDRYRPVRPDEQTCLTCHTPDRDNNFIYREKVEKIRCPAADH